MTASLAEGLQGSAVTATHMRRREQHFSPGAGQCSGAVECSSDCNAQETQVTTHGAKAREAPSVGVWTPTPSCYAGWTLARSCALC